MTKAFLLRSPRHHSCLIVVRCLGMFSFGNTGFEVFSKHEAKGTGHHRYVVRGKGPFFNDACECSFSAFCIRRVPDAAYT